MLLSDDGLIVRNQFLAPTQVHALATCAQRRRDRGEFKAARIGGGHEAQHRDEIRGDSIRWIVPPLFEAEQVLLTELERLRLELNRQNFLGLLELELHYAHYAPGAGYARHVDQPRGRMQRRLSMVLYLNDDWTPASGGMLRIFDVAGGYLDIEPLAGRLVCFLTTNLEHSVLPTTADRLSISGWFHARS